MSKKQSSSATADNQQFAEATGLQKSLQKLTKSGGFAFLESTIDGVANLNPERKARKKIWFQATFLREDVALTAITNRNCGLNLHLPFP